MDHPTELGAFLRHCRSRLRPDQVGLPTGGRRRSPGLRREEAAALSGVSVTWYARLEQGRAPAVSESVVEALARGLRLDDAERTHLRVLAGYPPEAARGTAPPDGSVERLLAALEPHPALALDPLWNVVGWNDAHRRVLVDVGRTPAPERNLIRLVFANAEIRSLMADWEDEAPILLAEYRADVAGLTDDPAHRTLVDELTRDSEPFRTWWSEHRVATFAPRPRRFRRPDGSTFVLEHQRLQLVAHPEVRLIAYVPPAPDPRTL